MKKYISFLVVFILLACQQNSDSLMTIYALPKKLKEVSGIIYLPQNKLLWTLEDSGNANMIYGLNFKNGKIEKEITLEKTKNIDWEDITKDNKGNLYVGDFGNNDNVRQDLCIYKINANELVKESVAPAYKIS
jgi:hypothetical protein